MFFFVIILFALFASIFSLQKIGLQYSEPLFLIGFRMVLSGLFLIYFEFSSKSCVVKIKIKHFFYFLLIAIFNIYLNSICEIWSINKMSSSKACMLYSLSPFITVFFAFFILGEKLNIIKFCGMILGFLGLTPMIYVRTLDEILSGTFFSLSLPEIVLIISVVFSVLGWIFLKKIINLGYSYIFANALSMFLGGIFILLHSFYLNNFWIELPVNSFKLFLFYTSVTSIISNFICYNLFGFLLKYYSAIFMSFAGLMTPLFAALFGWFILNENITYHYIVSCILFFSGLLLFHNKDIKK